MRISVGLSPAGNAIEVPIHYNHLLQGLIYGHMDPALAGPLHDQGYLVERRPFKLFVFSRLIGRFHRRDGLLIFTSEVRFEVASPIERAAHSLGLGLLRAGTVKLGQSLAQVQQIQVLGRPQISGSLLIRALSPITVYSTLASHDGKKKTYYYSPFEREFAQLVASNLSKKYRALTGHHPSSGELSITPIGVNKHNEALVTFKGTVIKGWTGRYRLDGSADLIALALDAGLGSKNSQGFGMIAAT